MPQTGSMLGFIILVVLVVIGVILYAYLTVMNQAKNEKGDEGETGKGAFPKYELAADLNAFAQDVKADLPSEVLLPLEEVKPAKTHLTSLEGMAKGRLETNLIAECPRCGKRLSSREVDQIERQVCETPNCKSDQYLLRWLPGNGFTQETPPAGE